MSERHVARLLGISHPRPFLDAAMLLTLTQDMRPCMTTCFHLFGLTEKEAAACSERALARVESGALAAYEAELTVEARIQRMQKIIELGNATVRCEEATRQLLYPAAADPAADPAGNAGGVSHGKRRRARRQRERQREKEAAAEPATPVSTIEATVLHECSSSQDAADDLPHADCPAAGCLHECRLCLEDVPTLATQVHPDGTSCSCVCVTCAAIMPPTCLRCFKAISGWRS